MSIRTSYEKTLTKVGVKYIQDPANFVAGRIFPACSVNLQSSQYPTYDKEYWFKNEARIRKPGTESAGGVHGRGEASYSCKDVSYHEDVPDEHVNNDPAPLNPLKHATIRVTQKIAIFDEIDFTTRFFTSGVWTTGAAPNPKWDAANSTPLEDVDAYKRQMRTLTGLNGVKAVMSEPVYDVLKRHAQVKEQVKYTAGGNISKARLAEIFELEEIIVMSAVYDSAAYGATASMGYIAADKFLLLHTTKSPSLEAPSAGYNFEWVGMGTNGYSVKQKRQENIDSERVEVHYYHDMKQVAADLGIFVDAPLT